MGELSEKTCTKCFKTKTIDNFHKDSTKKDGVIPRCKSCKKEDRHQSYIKDKDRVNLYARRWRESHREKVDEAAKLWNINNPGKNNIATKKYRLTHPEKSKQTNLSWRNRNKDKVKAMTARARRKRRLQAKFIISQSISSGILTCLKGNKNRRHWETLVDFTLEDLKTHLEKRFKDGMSWENYGKDGWHIDHIIPIVAFNFKRAEDIDFKRCWSLKNLQPLWAKENMKKNKRLTKHFQPSLQLAI